DWVRNPDLCSVVELDGVNSGQGEPVADTHRLILSMKSPRKGRSSSWRWTSLTLREHSQPIAKSQANNLNLTGSLPGLIRSSLVPVGNRCLSQANTSSLSSTASSVVTLVFLPLSGSVAS